jgi:hypothetical protein
LAYIYGASYKEWKEFMSEMKGRTQHIMSLCNTIQEEKRIGDFVAYPTRSTSSDLAKKEAVVRLELNNIRQDQIKERKIEALNRIKDWNENVASNIDIHGIIYHMGQVVNTIDWNDKDEVKKYTSKIQKEYNNQIVPLDLQFRLTKLLILLVNVMAEKGELAWNAVFNPYDRKHSLMMSGAIHDCFVLDYLRPFRDSHGNRIGDTKDLNIPKSANEIIQDKRYEDLVKKYKGQCWAVYESFNIESFEKEARNLLKKRPDVIGNRILLDPIASIIYQVGGYVTAPVGTRLGCYEDKVVQFINRANKSMYNRKKSDAKASREEEQFLYPMNKEYFMKTQSDRERSFLANMTPTTEETTRHEPAQTNLEQDSDEEDHPEKLPPDEEHESRASDEDSDELIEDSDSVMNEDEREHQEAIGLMDEEMLSTKPAANAASLGSDIIPPTADLSEADRLKHIEDERLRLIYREDEKARMARNLKERVQRKERYAVQAQMTE